MNNTPEMTPKVSVWSLLEKRFPAGEYALLAEVRDKAGHSASRAADGIAMSLWPSRGLEVIGIEIKSFRGDWLRELKNPAKAENIFQYCDRWYLVTAEENVAKLEEIPAAWGWLACKGSRIITMKEAPKCDPKALDRHFVAAMLKRASQGTVSIDSISDKIEAAREEGKLSANLSQTYELTRIKEQFEELKNDVKQFEEGSGLSIRHTWQGKKVGEAVKFILAGGVEHGAAKLKQLLTIADNMKTHIEWGLEQINETPIQ